MKVDILGTEYTLSEEEEDKDIRLKTNWGFIDFNTKQIIINKDVWKLTDDSCRDPEYFYKKVVRHEIIHAFLYESGLRENSFEVSAWAENEEMVDWFAIQSPKIFKVYLELEIMDGITKMQEGDIN